MVDIFSTIATAFWVILVQMTPADTSPPFPLPEFMENMVYIDAGSYERGCDQLGPEHGAPSHQVYLDAFMIDKYEVTNEQFEKVIPEHRYRRSKFSFCDKCPVSKVTWYDAVDYCHIVGKSLPSEAQWEKAAGGKSGCDFPWGSDFDPDNPQGRGGFKLKEGSMPVGSFAPNSYGIYDMGGNVWEWVTDWYAPYFFAEGQVLRNPFGPRRGQMKVRRGGSWPDSIISMRTGYRDWSYPFSRSFNDIGFRCVVNLKAYGQSN